MTTKAFQIIVRGVSSHGSTPHKGNDAITAASSVILHIQTIASRRIDAQETLTITVSGVHAGAQFNIVCDTAVIDGAVCFEKPEVGARAAELLAETAEYGTKLYGCSAELIWKKGKEAE